MLRRRPRRHHSGCDVHLDARRDAAESSLRSAYASGCGALEAMGLGTAVPPVCGPRLHSPDREPETTMTTRSRRRRRPQGRAAGLFLVTMLLGGAVVGCGGGGGGDDDGDGGGGGGGLTDAQLLACQTAVQAAGGAALASWLAAVDTCGAVVGCALRADVDGTDPEACLAAATSSCQSALGSATDPASVIGAALDEGQCAGLTIADLGAPLGVHALAPRCATVGGDVGSKGGVATCLGASVECAAAAALAASAPRAPGILSGRGVLFTDATCGQASISIHVGTVVTGDGGAVFDGIVDGFPGIAPLDGTPDIAGNQLGVGLKSGATEERGIAEFPLAALLGGLTADGITSAVLTFNVDDVLSTFGPGADFDGTASERIQIHVYSGDGTVVLADFAEGDGTPAAVVTTGAQGTITDATLAGSGPVVFEVDLTAQVKALVQAGATHLGIVFATDDANSGTSIDDLGPNSAGPPGVGGAKLPFVTINGSGEPTCGNGRPDPGEECDDGNPTPGDGCDAECNEEAPAPRCGDDNVDPGEECDDGNTTPGDGCDARCREEPPPASCGNGTQDSGEECDNGSANSDTAADACRTDCRRARCGDDVIDSSETCDDGTANSDTAADACRTDCRAATCGDGAVDTGEQCDPPGQSCSGTCQTITVDAAAQFIACQNALLSAAERARAEAGDATAACMHDETECVLADGDPASCRASADSQCTAAAGELTAARTSFRDAFPTVCVGRPPAELVLALELQSQVAACNADDLPTTTLSDLADCVFRAAACPVTRAYGELGAAGSASLANRGAMPAELACAGAP